MSSPVPLVGATPQDESQAPSRLCPRSSPVLVQSASGRPAGAVPRAGTKARARRQLLRGLELGLPPAPGLDCSRQPSLVPWVPHALLPPPCSLGCLLPLEPMAPVPQVLGRVPHAAEGSKF